MSSSSERIQELNKLFEEHRDAIVEDYLHFLRFQSISAESEFRPEVRNCCDWLAHYLKDIGFEVEVWETPGHPIISASWLKAGPEQPTILIYNHYDVQPVDPLNLWTHPPFEPAVVNGTVYARGAQDNKGQCWFVVSALKTLLKKTGALPINTKLVIEGEEEIGSVYLSQNLNEYAPKLKADHLLVVDVGLHDVTIPSVTLGVRGLVTMTVTATGSNVDLHSGSHGGIVYNPNRALVELLGKVFDAEGKITIPGFYDDVVEVTDSERKWLDFSFDEKSYQKDFSSAPTGGEKKYSPLESAWLRPTFEINGLSGGYSGEGFKTVIPFQAIAKISCRLVPQQDPMRIGELVKSYLEKNAPKGITVEVHIHPGVGAAMRTSPNSAIVQAAAQAFSETYGKKCRFILDGATIPITAKLSQATGANTVLIGYGLPSDRIHAPNEHFGLDRLQKGFVTIIRTLEILRA